MGKLTNAEHAERFGKRLSDIMYNRNMTQAQLAQALHVPNGTVYNWKHGLRIPRAATLDEICRVLMCTRADLMDDPVEPVTDTHRPVQEPVRDFADRDPALVLAALDSAGYGHLQGLFEAVKDADPLTVTRVTNMLKALQAK